MMTNMTDKQVCEAQDFDILLFSASSKFVPRQFWVEWRRGYKSLAVSPVSLFWWSSNNWQPSRREELIFSGPTQVLELFWEQASLKGALTSKRCLPRLRSRCFWKKLLDNWDWNQRPWVDGAFATYNSISWFEVASQSFSYLQLVFRLSLLYSPVQGVERMKHFFRPVFLSVFLIQTLFVAFQGKLIDKGRKWKYQSQCY